MIQTVKKVAYGCSLILGVLFLVVGATMVIYVLNDENDDVELAGMAPVQTSTFMPDEKTSVSLVPTFTATAAKDAAARVVVLPTVTPEPVRATDTATPKPTSTLTKDLQGIVNGQANIRSGPGTQYDIVGAMNKGESIIVAGSNDVGDWLQLDDGRWIASFLVDGLLSPVPTLPPTPTPTQTPTPNVAETASAERHAQATATIQAYINIPPVGIWCGENGRLRVCVGDFRYTNEISYSIAPSNGRFVAFAIGVANGGDTTTAANPNDVTVVMEDGRTYAYDSATFSYWAEPLEHVNIQPGNNAQGGIVFLVPNDVAIHKVIYQGGWFESPIELDLFNPPTNTATDEPTPSPELVMVDMPSLVGKSIAEVEAVLGEPIDPMPFAAGDFIGYSGAGESREYEVGKYGFLALFDTQGVLRGLQIVYGLNEDGYSLREWQKVLAMFGFQDFPEATVQAPAALRWDNLEGYQVNVLADGIHNDPIWSIQIFIPE